MLFQKLSETLKVAAQETQKKQMNQASVKHENSFHRLFHSLYV